MHDYVLEIQTDSQAIIANRGVSKELVEIIERGPAGLPGTPGAAGAPGTPGSAGAPGSNAWVIEDGNSSYPARPNVPAAVFIGPDSPEPYMLVGDTWINTSNSDPLIPLGNDAVMTAVAGDPNSGFAAKLASTFTGMAKVAATVSASGAAAINKHNPVDATAAVRTISLPTGQVEGTGISVEKIDSSANAVNVTGSIRGVGAATLPLVLQYESIVFRADSAGSWWPVAGHKTKTSLDALYASRTGAKPVGQGELVLNVEDFGAKGDGVTDDASAIQSALNTAAALTSRGVVLLGAKTYAATARLTVPDGVTFEGQGVESSILGHAVLIGSNAIVRNMKVGKAGSNSAFSNNSDGSRIERVHFFGGASTANLSLNDTKATNHTFLDCLFTDNNNGGNGVQIVDKATTVKHYENIRFLRCRFYNNDRMNFECIQRSDVGNPVVLGYRGIDLIECILDPSGKNSTTKINVSYDSGALASDATIFSSGYSTVRGCKITGGSYGLELAGARNMNVVDNVITATTSYPLSMSQISTNECHLLFRGNRVEATNDVVFAGSKNIIEMNDIAGVGTCCRFGPVADSLVSNNRFETTGSKCVSLENSFNNRFIGNDLIGGTGQVVLNIYPSSVDNAFMFNSMVSPNVGFDMRDSTNVYRVGNRRKFGTLWSNAEQAQVFPAGAALPTAINRGAGSIAYVTGATGVEDSLQAVVKNSANAYSWDRVITKRDQPVINVKDYGAVGDGATDDAAAFTSALAAAATVSGGVFVPPGTFALTNISIPAGVRLFGAGKSSILKAITGGANNYMIALGAANPLVERLTIDCNNLKIGLRIAAGGTDAIVRGVQVISTGGGSFDAFRCEGAVRPSFTDCTTNGAKYGILLNTGTTDATVIDCRFINSATTAISEGGIYVPNASRATFIGCHSITSASHGAFVGGSASDIVFQGCTFRGNGTTGGTDYRGASTAGSTRVTFNACLFDSNYECGVYLDGNTTHAQLVNCVSRLNNTGLRPGGHGYEIRAAAMMVGCSAIGQTGNVANAAAGFYIGGGGATLIGCRAESNYSFGIRVVDATLGTVLDGCRVLNNSQASAGTYHGIQVIGLTTGSCHDVQVVNNRCYDTQGTPTQGYGINMANTNVDFYVVTGNNTRGNLTGGLLDAGGANKAVASNI